MGVRVFRGSPPLGVPRVPAQSGLGQSRVEASGLIVEEGWSGSGEPRSAAILVIMFAGLWGGLVAAEKPLEFKRNLEPKRPVLRLSLHDAIKLALEHNYDLLLAQERIQESRGVALSRLGALLPNLSTSSDYRRFKTFQGEFGGRPVTSTPRNTWDSRAALRQSVFSLSLIQQWLAGEPGSKSRG